MNACITPSPYGTPYASLHPKHIKKRLKHLSRTPEQTYPPHNRTNTFIARYCSPAPTQNSQASSEVHSAQENIRQTAVMLNQLVSISADVDRKGLTLRPTLCPLGETD